MACRALSLAGWIALGALVPGAQAACGAQETDAAVERPTLHLRQTAPADVVGADDAALQAACDRLRKTGGTLVIGPGRHVIRRQVNLPPDLVLRGEPGAILAQPSPVLTARAAAAGSRELELAGAHELAAASLVQLLPPVGVELFPDGKSAFLDLQRIERVDGASIALRDALPFEVPAGSRVGYPTKLLMAPAVGRVTIEGLAFEGGKLDAIPMPGHHQRCAIWAAAPFGYGEQRLGPPGTGVVIRDCQFRDWYGRAIALYHQVDGRVERNVFERIADEAIDLDHFVERFEVRDNLVRDALWGISLNDASRCLVEGNRVEGGDIGIWIWWFDGLQEDGSFKIPPAGVNEENVVRGNTVHGTARASIRVDVNCRRNLIERNEVDGEIEVIEPENTVRDNVRATTAVPK